MGIALSERERVQDSPWVNKSMKPLAKGMGDIREAHAHRQPVREGMPSLQRTIQRFLLIESALPVSSPLLLMQCSVRRAFLFSRVSFCSRHQWRGLGRAPGALHGEALVRIPGRHLSLCISSEHAHCRRICRPHPSCRYVCSQRACAYVSRMCPARRQYPSRQHRSHWRRTNISATRRRRNRGTLSLGQNHVLGVRRCTRVPGCFLHRGCLRRIALNRRQHVWVARFPLEGEHRDCAPVFHRSKPAWHQLYFV